MATESFGKAKAPYPAVIFDCTYQDDPEQWNRGYRAWIAEVQELKGTIFVLDNNDGLALCMPPHVKFTGTLGGHFRADADAHAIQLSEQEAARKAEWLLALDQSQVKEIKRECLYMMELVVAHGKQVEGRGRALMEAVFTKAEALGCDVCSEFDTVDNKSMYEHMGFQVIKESTLPEYQGRKIIQRTLFRHMSKS